MTIERWAPGMFVELTPINYRLYSYIIYIWCSVGHPPSPPPTNGYGWTVSSGSSGPPPLWPVAVVWFFWSPPPCGLWWWYVGMLVCWYVGMLVCWYVGMLVCWYGMYVCIYTTTGASYPPPHPMGGGGWEHGTRDHIYFSL